jgi:hypothetical protein
MADLFDPSGDHGVRDSDGLPPRPADRLPPDELMALTVDVDTSAAGYVWLPFRFDGDVLRLDWRDEWSIDEFA